MTALPPFLDVHPHGVHVVDTAFQRDQFDASYLLVENGRAAFIDTGTNHAVRRLLRALGALGLQPQDVDYVIATHVHLDHAGGVGLLMQSLPDATLVVHPRGARHLIDPTALVAGATEVYGKEEMARSYGALQAVPAERVLQSHDGMRLELNGRPLEFLDTPGHARHHHCIWDERSRGFFTGDTFGLSYREFDTDQGAYVMPTTTPVQFEPEALRDSINRMLSYQPEVMYLTHYGPVYGVPRLAAQFFDQLDAMVALARSLRDAPDRHEALKQGLAALSLDRLHAHGSTLADERILELLSMDIELNAQGIGVWLDKEAR